MNNNNDHDLIHLYDEISHEEHSRLQDQLTHLPHPTLDDEARMRILHRVHMAIDSPQAEDMPIITRTLKFTFPAQSALQLAASVAVFVLILYQFGLPAIHDDTSIKTIYPIQRSVEMQDVDLIAEYFS